MPQMNSRVLCSSILGINAYIVEIEASLSCSQLPGYVIVGLPNNAVKENRECVTAISNSGYKFLNTHITINLAPADNCKEGSAFDLPVAIEILADTENVKSDYLNKLILLNSNISNIIKM